MEDKKHLISVICPVYNAEKTVSKMIDSVLSQTYPYIQLIVIDDVSKDETPRIVAKKAEEDSRVILIQNKRNMGPGPAKNAGIERATGDYITFIDGDDWIEPSAYEELLNAISISNADVAVMGYVQDFLDTNDNIKYSVTILPPHIDGTETTPQILAHFDAGKIFSFCCFKLFRASVLKNNPVQFPPILHSEDFFFNMQALPFIHKTTAVEKAFYHYIKPSGKTLTSGEFIDGFYEISNKRYNAIKDYCVSENAFSGETRALIADTHLKHLMMCLMYNAAKQSGMKHKERLAFAKKMLANENTTEAMLYAAHRSRATKMIYITFKTKSPFWLVASGRFLNFCKTKLSFLFHKLK